MTFPNLEVSLTREYFLLLRDGLLKQVDAIERLLEISPRTVELRREAKAERYAVEIPQKENVVVK